MYIHTHEAIQAHEGLGQLGQNDIDQAIGAAKRQMDKYVSSAAKTNNLTAALKEIAIYGEWSREHDFLEGLKAVYEFSGRGSSEVHELPGD